MSALVTDISIIIRVHSPAQHQPTADTMIFDEQYLKIADEAFNEALEIVRSTDGWKVEKEEKENNVIVEMKKNSKGRKIYRCKVS